MYQTPKFESKEIHTSCDIIPNKFC